MRKALLITVVAALPLLAAAGYATANDQSDLAELRQATVAYHDIAVAKAEFPDAIELPRFSRTARGRASRTSKAPVQWASTCSSRTGSTRTSS